MRYVVGVVCVVALGVTPIAGCADVDPRGTGGMGGIVDVGTCTGGRCDDVQEAQAFCELAIDSCNEVAADVPQSSAVCDAMGYDIFCGGGGSGGTGGAGGTGGSSVPAADCDGITCQMTPDLRRQCDEFAHECTRLYCSPEGCPIDCLAIAELMFCNVDE